MNICTDATGLIVMLSTGQPTPPDGGSFFALDDQQSADLAALQATPNGGIRYASGVFTALPVPPNPADEIAAARALIERRIAALEGRPNPSMQDQIDALKLRLSLVQGA